MADLGLHTASKMPHRLLSKRGCRALFPLTEKEREKKAHVFQLSQQQKAEIYPSPGLQKSRLLFCKHQSVVRGLQTSREGRWRPAASERGRGQAKVKPKAQGFGGQRLSRQGWGRGDIPAQELCISPFFPSQQAGQLREGSQQKSP